MTEVGKITRVRDETSGSNEILVDVRVSPTISHKNIRYRSPSKDIWIVPEVGDIVEITEKRSGESVAHSAAHNESLPPDYDITEGQIIINTDKDVVIKTDSDIILDGENEYIISGGQKEQIATQ